MMLLKAFQVNLLLVIVFTFLSCKDSTPENNANFKLIEKRSYYIDSYNGLSLYRDNETKKPMDGYFVVGDKFKKWEEFKLKNGLIHGEYIIFHENGEFYSKSNYLNGKQHGEEKFYSLSGKLSKVNTYKNGKRYGKSIRYFENGQIKRESKIKDEKEVESISYNIIGEIESQMFIKDGRKITQEIRAGKVFFEHISSTYDNFEAVKLYNEDGSLKKFLRTFEDNENFYLIELDKNENEIKRINLKDNPQEILKYKKYF